MANDKNIRKSVPLATPDFDSIKTSLRQYLAAREELSDFEFESSIMSILVELLSYNSHAKAFYLNMIGNEAFLSTAVRRDSVVAKAQDLGYEAKSDRAARAVVDVEFIVTDPMVELLLVDKGTVFSGGEYNFVTDASGVIPRNLTDNTFKGRFELFQGKPLTFRYTYSSDRNEEGFMLPNENIDTTLMKITVNENDTSNRFVEYRKVDRILDVDANSRVYFLLEKNGLFYIKFGNGFFGRELPNGAKILIEYVSTSGALANDIKNFTLTSEIGGVESSIVTVVEKSSGGRARESIDSIKFNAPRVRQAQNRAVTETDYETVVRENILDARDVVAWGGEKATPPSFGSIFIAIRPQGSLFYTEEEKRTRLNVIKRFSVSGLTPKIVDPEYLFIRLNIGVNFDRNESGKHVTQIADAVRNQVRAYEENELNGVNRGFMRSVVTRYIDSADVSIISSTLSYSIERRELFFINRRRKIEVNFGGVLIKPETLRSSSFVYNGVQACSFRSNENGTINIIANEQVVEENVGTIDTVRGVVIDTLEYGNIDLIEPSISVPYIAFIVDSDMQEINSGARSFLELRVERIEVNGR